MAQNLKTNVIGSSGGVGSKSEKNMYDFIFIKLKLQNYMFMFEEYKKSVVNLFLK